MRIMGFFVRVIVTDDMEAEKVEREVAHSIGFGHPQVTYLFDYPKPQGVSQVMPRHDEPLAHDGYATHTHEVRPDHLGVHRKEWPENP